MAASKCSPAVASRRENYVDEFRVPTLLGAKLRSQKFVLAANEHYFCDGYLRLYSAVPEGMAGRTSHARKSQKFTFSLAAKSAESLCIVAAFVVN
jgi:hypothetical protein